jgi:hypothetical protein
MLAILKTQGSDSLLAKALGKDFKGKFSIILYGLAIPLSFINHWIADCIYMLVALIWLIPDKRIEKIFIEIQE